MRAAVILSSIVLTLTLLYVIFNSALITNTKLGNMKIESSAFKHNEIIPQKYTCDGENVSLPLSFSNIPNGTKTLALIMDDPDAPVGLWVHWTLWNISPGTKEIKENSVPKGAVEGMTNFGKPGYGGPCPPDGEHRYFFKLYALDAELNLSKETDKGALEEAMMGHVLEKAELIGLYSR
ncbi:MAG: YbhB/YbcL family Raf kinase inhibitor-like protein [Parcubacteria group bacterium]|nr:YbhB/YbcL family Raf kinase inhibitor-like protein [Parcubacteria group bacterium]